MMIMMMLMMIFDDDDDNDADDYDDDDADDYDDDLREFASASALVTDADHDIWDQFPQMAHTVGVCMNPRNLIVFSGETLTFVWYHA